MLSSRCVRILLAAFAATAAVVVGCGTDDRDPFADNNGGSSSGSSGNFQTQDSGNGVDSAFDPDAACATTKIEAKRAPANILFIVDRSGSMNCNPPPTTTSAACEQNPTTADTGKPTKWQITKDAIKSALGKLQPPDAVGLTLFNVDNDCGVISDPNVPVAPIDMAQQTLVGQRLDNVAPEGLTPIVGAVTLGYNHLHTNAFVGRLFLVLITDGQETCAQSLVDDFLTKTVPNAAAVGIRTFVIGAPGSEPARSFLSRMAFAGQTPTSPTCKHSALPQDVGDCHFDLTDPSVDLSSALGTALDKISRDALTCEYDVPASDGGALDLARVNVIYSPAGGTPTAIPQDPTKDCQGGADGWQYTADQKHIVLCGPSCDKVKTDTTGSVSVALGCLTVVR